MLYYTVKASKVLKFKDKRMDFKKHIELDILIDKTIYMAYFLINLPFQGIITFLKKYFYEKC